MDDKNPLTELLRPYVKAIEEDAANGDRNAQQIISLYGMYYRCPSDPAAPVFCKEFFKKWRHNKMYGGSLQRD